MNAATLYTLVTLCDRVGIDLNVCALCGDPATHGTEVRYCTACDDPAFHGKVA